jgi:PD-(D/E)XK nuclease superfamily
MNKGLEKHVDLTEQIIASCCEVHKILGQGLEEKFHRDALAYELELRGIPYSREQEFLVEYKSKPLGAAQGGPGCGWKSRGGTEGRHGTAFKRLCGPDHLRAQGKPVARGPAGELRRSQPTSPPP